MLSIAAILVIMMQCMFLTVLGALETATKSDKFGNRMFSVIFTLAIIISILYGVYQVASV